MLPPEATVARNMWGGPNSAGESVSRSITITATGERDTLDPIDTDIFRIEVILEALAPTFFAKPAFLDPAKGRLDRGDQVGIDADHAVSQSRIQPKGTAQIAGIDIGAPLLMV